MSESAVSVFLTKHLAMAAAKGKSEDQIASEIGYEKPTMISMFKRGEAKVPLDKIPLLAKALNVDPAFLFRLAMQQYWPDLNQAVTDIFGTVLSQGERELLALTREMTGGADLELTPDLIRGLREVLSTRIH